MAVTTSHVSEMYSAKRSRKYPLLFFNDYQSPNAVCSPIEPDESLKRAFFMSANQSVRNTAGTTSTVNRLDSTVTQGQASPIQCPACGAPSNRPALENFHSASLYECPGCDLHFWHPATMPDAEWHEQTYQRRDQTALPLEPGHQFFLLDPKAPSMDDCSISVAAWEIFLRRRVTPGSKLRALN
jgi:hypothetical protein